VLSAFPHAKLDRRQTTQYATASAPERRKCDCAPDEHVCAFKLGKTHADTGRTAPVFGLRGARFVLAADEARVSRGGLALLRTALQETRADANGDLPPLILESNSLLQFVKPSLYFAVVDPAKEDFKDSARAALYRADALVLAKLFRPFPQQDHPDQASCALLKEKPSVRSAKASRCRSLSTCSFSGCWKGQQVFPFDNAALQMPHLSR